MFPGTVSTVEVVFPAVFAGFDPAQNNHGAGAGLYALDILKLHAQVDGFIAVTVSAIMFGSFSVFLKTDRVKRANVDTMVYQVPLLVARRLLTCNCRSTSPLSCFCLAFVFFLRTTGCSLLLVLLQVRCVMLCALLLTAHSRTMGSVFSPEYRGHPLHRYICGTRHMVRYDHSRVLFLGLFVLPRRREGRVGGGASVRMRRNTVLSHLSRCLPSLHC